jgi:hypothetical protein
MESSLSGSWQAWPQRPTARAIVPEGTTAQAQEQEVVGIQEVSMSQQRRMVSGRELLPTGRATTHKMPSTIPTVLGLAIELATLSPSLLPATPGAVVTTSIKIRNQDPRAVNQDVDSPVLQVPPPVGSVVATRS